jgi:hypothetical protein
MAPDNIEGLLFQPVEVDARSVSGRAFIRAGQAQGSVTSDTITFAAVAIMPVDMSVIMQEQQRRANQAKASTKAREIRRDYIKRLRAQIEDRLKGGVPEAASANGAKASK